jgi:hypothetical protein
MQAVSRQHRNAELDYAPVAGCNVRPEAQPRVAYPDWHTRYAILPAKAHVVCPLPTLELLHGQFTRPQRPPPPRIE